MTEKKPKATHEGKLKIGDTVLDVAVLDDGRRVITQGAIFRSLGRPQRGNSRQIGIPVFMDALNLQPFISNELRGVISRIDYVGRNGTNQTAYDATMLPLVADLYLRAREAGKIVLDNQKVTAQKAEILVRSLAKVGITALVDEATGYQYDRERQELQKILKHYISQELLPWEKRFPDEFYREIFRLKGWPYTVNGIRARPSVIGRWTRKFIYSRLPKGVLEALLNKTPRDEKGNLKTRLHQHLTKDQGVEHLNKQIVSVVTLMNVSDGWTQFERLWNKKFGQQAMEFDEAMIIPEDTEASNKPSSDFDATMEKISKVPHPIKMGLD